MYSTEESHLVVRSVYTYIWKLMSMDGMLEEADLNSAVSKGQRAGGLPDHRRKQGEVAYGAGDSRPGGVPS
jgi:hypothetical protein